jgi:hypothetical protein
MLQEVLKRYPELMKQPIIYTYGDDVSLRMYGPRGFVEADQKLYPPIQDGKTKWRLLVATPADMLASFLGKKPGTRFWGTGTGPIRIRLKDGRSLIADASQWVQIEDGKPVSFVLDRRQEVAKDVWAEKGTLITLDLELNLKRVGDLEFDLKLEPNLIAEAGLDMAFHSNGEVAMIRSIKKNYPTQVKGRRYVARAGTEIVFAPERVNGKRVPRLIHPTKPVEMFPGIFADPEGTHGIQWGAYGPDSLSFQIMDYLHQEANWYASKGSVVAYFLKEGKWELGYIEEYSREFEGPNGKYFSPITIFAPRGQWPLY